jgi:hypothetical protein
LYKFDNWIRMTDKNRSKKAIANSRRFLLLLFYILVGLFYSRHYAKATFDVCSVYYNDNSFYSEGKLCNFCSIHVLHCSICIFRTNYSRF